DSIIFMNFRADRAREITRAFVEDDFTGFTRQARPRFSSFVMLTEYSADLNIPCAYPPESLTNGLGEYLANLGKTQLRIAETEKYAQDRKSTRLNSSHVKISYAVFCLKKKKQCKNVNYQLHDVEISDIIMIEN